MEHTIINILEAHGQRKQDFIKNFSTQITSVDKIIADVISEDTNFSAALVTFIRLSLSHLEDSTTTIKHIIKDIYQDNNTNSISTGTSLPNEQRNPSNILDTPSARGGYQHNHSHFRNDNKHTNDKLGINHHYTDTSQNTRLEQDTKYVNKTTSNQEQHHNNITPPKKDAVNNTNINASRIQSCNDDTSRDLSTTIYTRKDITMDIDVNVIRPSWNDNTITTVHTNHQDQFNIVDIIHNPWSDNVTTEVKNIN